jgi:hypothetical protein
MYAVSEVHRKVESTPFENLPKYITPPPRRLVVNNTTTNHRTASTGLIHPTQRPEDQTLPPQKYTILVVQNPLYLLLFTGATLSSGNRPDRSGTMIPGRRPSSDRTHSSGNMSCKNDCIPMQKTRRIQFIRSNRW